ADRDVDAAEAALAGVPVRAAVLNEALHLVSAVRHHATSGTRNMSARVAHSSADQPARSAPSSSFKDFTPSTSSRSKYDSTTIRAVSASSFASFNAAPIFLMSLERMGPGFADWLLRNEPSSTTSGFRATGASNTSSTTSASSTGARRGSSTGVA